jgi:hypothetical protein
LFVICRLIAGALIGLQFVVVTLEI